MPSLKDIAEAPGKIKMGIKSLVGALLLVIALQGVTIWLLLTRLPIPH